MVGCCVCSFFSYQYYSIAAVNTEPSTPATITDDDVDNENEQVSNNEEIDDEFRV